MARALRWTGIALVAIVGLVAVALAAMWFLLPAERIARIAAERASAITGREIRIDGATPNVSTRFGLGFGVVTGPVSVANAPWGAAPYLLEARSATLTVAFWPLLRGEIALRQMQLDGAALALEINEAGEANWVFGAAGAPGAGGDGDGGGDGGKKNGLPAISVREALLRDASVGFVDRRDGREARIEALELRAAMPSLDDQLTASVTGAWRGAPVAAEIALASVAALQEGREAELDLTLSALGGEVGFVGRLRLPGEGGGLGDGGLDGAIRLSAGDANAVAAAFGMALPEALGAVSALDFAGNADVSAATLALRLTGSAVRAGATVTLDATLAGGDGWLAARKVNLALTAASQDLFSMRWDGGGAAPDGAPPAVSGKLALAAPRPAKLMRWAGFDQPPPALARLRGVDLSADLVYAPAGESRLDGEIAAMLGRNPVAAQIGLSGIEALLEGGAAALELKARLAEAATLGFSGQVSNLDDPALSGDIDIAVADMRKTLRVAGALPEGLARKALRTARLRGRIKASAQAASIANLRVELDGMTATGRASAAMAGRPAFSAALATGPLDLRPLLGRIMGKPGATADAGAPAKTGKDEGWSKAPIDLSGLAALDADIALTAPSIRLPGFKLGALDAAAQLKGGALDLDVRKLRMFGGKVTGRATVAGGQTNRVDLDLSAAAISLRPLLRVFAGIDKLEGKGRATLRVTSAGKSMEALMRGLNGDAAIRLRDGALRGVNVAAMVRNLTGAFDDGTDAKAKKTDFSAISASFAIRDGRATTSDLRALGPLFRLNGKGWVDIGKQRLSMRVTPKAVATLKGQGGGAASGLMVPLLIKGKWSDPRIRPDLKGAVDNALRDPGAAADQARDLLRLLPRGD